MRPLAVVALLASLALTGSRMPEPWHCPGLFLWADHDRAKATDNETQLYLAGWVHVESIGEVNGYIRKWGECWP